MFHLPWPVAVTGVDPAGGMVRRTGDHGDVVASLDPFPAVFVSSRGRRVHLRWKIVGQKNDVHRRSPGRRGAAPREVTDWPGHLAGRIGIAQSHRCQAGPGRRAMRARAGRRGREERKPSLRRGAGQLTAIAYRFRFAPTPDRHCRSRLVSSFSCDNICWSRCIFHNNARRPHTRTGHACAGRPW